MYGLQKFTEAILVELARLSCVKKPKGTREALPLLIGLQWARTCITAQPALKLREVRASDLHRAEKKGERSQPKVIEEVPSISAAVLV